MRDVDCAACQRYHDNIRTSLDDLIRDVLAHSDSSLNALEAASSVAADLMAAGDALLTHFVVESRAAGNTWAEIGKVLGVSRQAVHQRFVDAIGEDGLRAKMTPDAQRVLDDARRIASDLSHAYIGTEHLLLALFESKERASLEARGVTAAEIEEQVLDQLPRGSTTVEGAQPITPRARKALEEAISAAEEADTALADTEHLLLGLFRGQDGLARRLLLGEEAPPRDPAPFADD
jgi:hypothetical protein